MADEDEVGKKIAFMLKCGSCLRININFEIKVSWLDLIISRFVVFMQGILWTLNNLIFEFGLWVRKSLASRRESRILGSRERKSRLSMMSTRRLVDSARRISFMGVRH